MKLKSIAAVPAVFLSACTTVHPPTQLYEGSLPAGVAPALVKPASAIVITSIDGKRVHFAAMGTMSGNDHELQLAPGLHNLTVGYNDGARMGAAVPVSIELKSGRKYVLREAFNAKYFGITKWRPVVIDATDRPHCWSSLVGVMFGPNGCEE